VKLAARDYVVEFPGGYGFPCSVCGETDQTVQFRRYRRVVGLIVFDRIYDFAGYACSDCQRLLFRDHIKRTMLLGWCGILAVLFRNPYAIAVNIRARSRPPSDPWNHGAISLDDVAEGSDDSNGAQAESTPLDAASQD
jgi:hypothetical protein